MDNITMAKLVCRVPASIPHTPLVSDFSIGGVILKIPGHLQNCLCGYGRSAEITSPLLIHPSTHPQP
jgi:hypothetical protein